jgi:hypothetical protein
VCAFVGEQMPARIGYGLASAMVLVAAGIASFDILESRPVEVVASVPERPAEMETASLNLNAQVEPLPDLPSITHTTSFSTPRYVMDARPVSVSYVPPSSF